MRILRWLGWCKHEELYCLHGDEIFATMRSWPRKDIARVRCTKCHKPIYGVSLPEICTKTGQPHSSTKPRRIFK